MRFNKSTGFTIIELVVVILIVGIVAAYVTVRTPQTASFDMSDSFEALKYDLRLTQILSMSLNERYRFVIDTANDSYEIQDASGTPFYNPAAEATSTVLPGNIQLTGNHTTLIFDGRGLPRNSSGSNSAISTPATYTLTLGSDVRTVSVEPQTGLVHD